MIYSDDMASGVRFVAALGCGLMAGVFFTFSTFVMRALARLPSEQGIAAMQSINVFAVKSWFLVAFLGTAALSGYAAISAVNRWGESSAMLLLAGGAVFLVGCFLVTMIFNVPMNNALASMPANDPERTARWARYLTEWTIWNHVRTMASLAAAALLMAGWAGERKRPSLLVKIEPTQFSIAVAERGCVQRTSRPIVESPGALVPSVRCGWASPKGE